MKQSSKILFAGGDGRMIAAAEAFQKKGHRVSFTGLEKAKTDSVPFAQASDLFGEADAVVLPLPYSRDGKTLEAPFSEQTIPLRDLFARCEKTAVLGGMLPETDGRKDYYDEVMILQNADVTAEAALVLAGQASETTFAGGTAIVLGYGRIGKRLASKLRSLGCSVIVAARKEKDRALIRLDGCEAVDCADASSLFGEADFVFNTVPAALFPEETFDGIPDFVPVIDLANSLTGKRVRNAKGLPGKYAPVRAGQILAEAIERTLGREDNV